MRAELKGLESPDIDLETYRPEDEEVFGFYLYAMIGAEGDDASDSFGFEICSPKWLIETKRDQGLVAGRFRLILFEYNIKVVEDWFRRLCARTYGNSWEEIVHQLERFGQWEFEDYQEGW